MRAEANHLSFLSQEINQQIRDTAGHLRVMAAFVLPLAKAMTNESLSAVYARTFEKAAFGFAKVRQDGGQYCTGRCRCHSPRGSNIVARTIDQVLKMRCARAFGLPAYYCLSNSMPTGCERSLPPCHPAANNRAASPQCRPPRRCTCSACSCACCCPGSLPSTGTRSRGPSCDWCATRAGL